MNPDNIHLRPMLRLLTQQLAPNDRASLILKIDSEHPHQRRWALVQQLASAGPDRGWQNPDISEEVVASYLDDQMTLDEESCFESACWQDRNLLAEVISLYVAQTELACSNWLASPLPASADHGPIKLNPARQRTRQPGVRSQRILGFAVAGVLILAMATGLYWLASSMLFSSIERDRAQNIVAPLGENQPSMVQHQDNSSRAHSEDLQGPLPEVTDHQLSSAATGASQSAKGPELESKEMSRPELAVDQNSLSRPDGSKLPSDIDIARPSPTNQNQRSAIEPATPRREIAENNQQLHWEGVTGLFALRSTANGRYSNWHGPEGWSATNARPQLLVFPHSVVTCQLPAGGTVFAGGNSLFAITRLDKDPDSVTSVELQRGALAFEKLPLRSAVELAWDDQTVRITVLAEASVWEIGWDQDVPRLTVSAGEVEIEGIHVREREYYDLAGVGSGRPQAVDQPLISWWRDTHSQLSWSRTNRERLSASQDMLGDLKSLSAEGSRQQMILANHWLVAADPENHLVAALGHTDPRIREQAANWLLSLPTAGQQNQRIWRELQTGLARPRSNTAPAESVRPITLRTIMAMARANRYRTAVTLADTEPLLEALASPHLAIRQLSAAVLETRFGNPANYRADDELAGRVASGRAWAELIRKSYQRGRPR